MAGKKYFVYVLVISTLHFLGTYCASLYKHRVCHSDFYDHTRIDCIKQNLTAIPQLPCDRGYVKELWLSGNKIPALTHGMLTGFSKLQALWLDSNAISKITPDVLSKLPQLRYLNLANNSLTLIHEYTFAQLQLEVLDLSNNPISSLADGAFKSQKLLKELYMTGCSLTRLTYDMFSGNQTLQTLAIENCKVSTLDGHVFKSLHKLTSLSLTGNRLTNLDSTAFHGLSNLEYLDLSSNNLSTVTSNLCSYTPQLRTLRYSYNVFSSVLFDNTYVQCKNFTQLELTSVMNTKNHLNPDSFLGIRHNVKQFQFNNNIYLNGFADLSAFSELILLNLSSSSLRSYNTWQNSMNDWSHAVQRVCVKTVLLGNITVLEGPFTLPAMLNYVMQEINKSCVELLDLSYNNITSIPNNTFEKYTSLASLGFQHNKIVHIEADAFNGLHNLRELNLHDNYIWTIEPGTFNFSMDFPLVSLILSENILALWQEGAFTGLKNLTHLNLADQGKIRIGKEYFLELPNLETLDLSGNTFGNGFHLPLCNLSHLQTLNVSHSWIHSRYVFPFDDLSEECPGFTSSITTMDFSTSFIDDIDMLSNYMYRNQEAFKNVKKLWLSAILSLTSHTNEFPWEIFTNLSNLEQLKIAANHIDKLPANAFVKLTNLKELDLSVNNIPSIDDSKWHGLNNLQILDLHENAIDRIDGHTFAQLESLSHLYLEHNNYECDCGFATFVDFVNSKQGRALKLTSRYQNYEIKPYWFQDFLCDLPRNLHGQSVIDLDPHQPFICYDIKHILIFTIIALVALYFLIFILYLFFRYEIRYYWFLLRLKCSCGTYERLPDNDENYAYDVNISCCQTNEAWAQDTLLPYLENTLELRVHIKSRDMPPGTAIPKYIADLIWKKSRKTVFVISKAFIEDGLCMHELTLAFQKLFDESMNVMVFVTLEDIPNNRLPQILRFPLCQKRQIKWMTYTERTREEFWHVLRHKIDCHPHVQHVWQIY